MQANPKTTGIAGPFDPQRKEPLATFRPDAGFNEDCLPPKDVAFDNFLTDERRPYGDGSVSIGFVPEELRAAFSKSVSPYSYFEEPLKQAGTDEHFIPPEFSRFEPVLRMIANYEFSRSIWAPYKKATLLLERIIPEEDYPVGKWHQDQPPGSQTVCHIYTVSDVYPSIIQHKARQTDYGYNRAVGQPALDGTDSPVPGEDLDRYFRQIAPYEIIMTSGYNIHRADILPQGTERTLLRVIYEGIPKDETVLPQHLRDQLEQARRTGAPAP